MLHESADPFEQQYVQNLERAKVVCLTPVKGCLSLQPYGMKIWERIRKILQEVLSQEGYENTSFPTFIPKSSMETQDEHGKDFLRETVMGTSAGEEKFDDPLIIRPTSEAIIYPTIKSWIQTADDLPLKINQWCSVVRWEILKPNFPLIRDNEFQWHEAHSLHETEEEAQRQAKLMHDAYKTFFSEIAAIPVFEGIKPERRKFAGAEKTWALEAMMPNKKSVQIATSHYLGQRFSSVFDLSFEKEGGRHLVWQACSGMTTRVLGALAMVHGDEQGLCLPPRIAPYQVAMLDGEIEEAEDVLQAFRCTWQFSEFEAITKGVPIIVTSDSIIRRDTLERVEKQEDIHSQISSLLKDIQEKLYLRASSYKDDSTLHGEDYEKMKSHIGNGHGFMYAPWCEDTQCSRVIRKETLGSLRCVNTLEGDKECIGCKKEAKVLALFGQSY